MSDFTPLSLSEMGRYTQLHTICNSRASDYSFTNLWGWAEFYGLEWRFEEMLCWIRQRSPNTASWAPVGDWQAVDWKNCPELTSGSSFIRVPEPLACLWQEALPGRVRLEETREHWDYLYLAEELATLPGNRFHKKKNLFNQFRKLYPTYEYHPLTIECVESVLIMQEEWCQWRECMKSDSLLAENTAVERVLRNWDRLPQLKGGFIVIDGKVVAYTVGERLTEDTLVIHFEKGCTEHKGVYQAINRLFAEDVRAEYLYLNREQDTGDEGLRKAKESYNPVDYVKKFTVFIE